MVIAGRISSDPTGSGWARESQGRYSTWAEIDPTIPESVPMRIRTAVTTTTGSKAADSQMIRATGPMNLITLLGDRVRAMAQELTDKRVATSPVSLERDHRGIREPGAPEKATTRRANAGRRVTEETGQGMAPNRILYGSEESSDAIG